MKNIHINILLIIIITIALICGCAISSNENSKLPEINIIDISHESNWNYIVSGAEDYYFIRSNGSIPTAVKFYSVRSNNSFSVFFSNDGYLDKIVMEDYIFSFRNPNGSKIDIGILHPNGEIEILRNLDTNYDWDNYTLNSINNIKAWSSVIRWTGRIVSGVPCGLSIVAAAHTGGIGAPLAYWACGNYILGLSADIFENEFEIHNGYTNFVNAWGTTATIGSCSGKDFFIECVSDLTSRGFSEWADHREEIENRINDVNLLDSALEYGYGDVQITLTWNQAVDLDLWVTDPFGERIWWMNTSSNSGGQLDRDNIAGYGPENIFWAPNTAPSGNYFVQVDYYSGNIVTNYTVLVQAFGKTKVYSGVIQPNETIDVVMFNSIEPLPNAIMINHSKVKNIAEKLK
jgi:hypothetical protein